MCPRLPVAVTNLDPVLTTWSTEGFYAAFLNPVVYGSPGPDSVPVHKLTDRHYGHAKVPVLSLHETL